MSISNLFFVADDTYDYLENNQNHTNHLSASITVELIPPAKYQQESVIISTESARNMMQEHSEAEEHNEHDYDKSVDSYTKNKEGYSKNKDAYLKNKDSYSKNKEGYSKNKDSCSKNKDTYSSSKDTYSLNKDSFSQSMDIFPQNMDTFPQSMDSFGQSLDSFPQNMDTYNQNMENYVKTMESFDKSVESTAGVHFLSNDENAGVIKIENQESYDKKKNELLEYLTRHDGSVVCKLCGEVLASRTHWYRHKYKLHVNNMVNPAPLFKCTHCNVFFKSRKGYMGHISARHSENIEQQEELNISIKEEVVETVEMPKINKKAKEPKGADWEEQRVKEEKLVADIIDRVRKECEAQGAAVTRRGYSRRSTVMMNSS